MARIFVRIGAGRICPVRPPVSAVPGKKSIQCEKREQQSKCGLDFHVIAPILKCILFVPKSVYDCSGEET